MPQLMESDTKPADATGKAVCQVQPLRAFERWHITNVSINSTSSVKVPTVKMYRGSESPSSFIDGSYVGTFNSTSDPIDLDNGQRLLCVFENADVGSSCCVVVTGMKIGR